MSIEMYITLGVIVVAIIMFALEIIRVDLVALMIIVVLALTGVLSPDDAFQGFANEATITVAAMFVLSRALIKTRIIEFIGPFVESVIKKGYFFATSIMSLIVGLPSAFVNNTPIVATFIPIITYSSRNQKVSPSRYLIPLSYIAIFGGTCTLIGTSTNLLVHSMAQQSGHQGLEMFTLAPIGLIFFIVGIVYLNLFGKKLIPERLSSDELETHHGAHNFIAEIQLKNGHNQVQVKDLFEADKIDVKFIKRKDQTLKEPKEEERIYKEDTLLIEGNLNEVRKLIKADYIKIADFYDPKKFPDQETRLLEVVLLPNSTLIGKKLKEVDFLNKFQSNVIGVRHRGNQNFDDLESIEFTAGDILALLTNEKGYNLLKSDKKEEENNFILLKEDTVKEVNKTKILSVIAVILGVVLTATMQLIPISISAIAGVILLVTFDLIKMPEIYRAIDWQIITLLAGSLSLGKAMETSGLSSLLADKLINLISIYGNQIILVAIFYLATSLLTEIMSNNAAAALMVPIAISISQALDYQLMPLLVTVCFAGSASFMTPIGYQTNTMVYSAGGYQFKDFMSIGLPLNLLFWLIASLLIPLLYPF